MSYYDIYQKRLNRYGDDYWARKQGKREREFEDYLLKSVYRIDFEIEGQENPAILEPNKQDKSQLTAYLLTRINLMIPNGTILQLPNKDNQLVYWMIWWLEDMRASGYNRYTVLKMTHEIKWGDNQSQMVYLYGPGTAKVKEVLKSRINNSVYTEEDNLFMFITSTNKEFKKDFYFEIEEKEITQAFNIADFDIISTPGVGYYSLDPVFIRDLTPPPEKQEGDSDEDFYWLDGGK